MGRGEERGADRSEEDWSGYGGDGVVVEMTVVESDLVLGSSEDGG